jgi:hypothetical protein
MLTIIILCFSREAVKWKTIYAVLSILLLKTISSWQMTHKGWNVVIWWLEDRARVNINTTRKCVDHVYQAAGVCCNEYTAMPIASVLSSISSGCTWSKF